MDTRFAHAIIEGDVEKVVELTRSEYKITLTSKDAQIAALEEELAERKAEDYENGEMYLRQIVALRCQVTALKDVGRRDYEEIAQLKTELWNCCGR